MRILVDNGAYKCGNMGDVAMLQVTVARLRARWPAAEIRVFTADPDALATHVPDARPLAGSARSEWFSDDYLLGRVHDHLPMHVSRALSATKRLARRRVPAVLGPVVIARARLSGGRADELRDLLDSVRSCDLLVSCGQGSLGDHCVEHSHRLLNTLDMAALAGARTAMFGQGLGPMRDPGLRRHAAQVLPRVDLICLRERTTAARLVADLGVDPSRVATTGDDAIEPAFASRPAKPGAALGVNVRSGQMAGIHAAAIDTMRRTIQSFCSDRGAGVLPIPISHQHSFIDANAIRTLLHEIDDSTDGGQDLDTPAKVIAQVGHCRTVVTGAYHAAVFALAQGIPVVCFANSDFFRIKFHGLAEMFGCGCEVVDFAEGDVERRMRSALDDAWTSADQCREPLLRAAQTQIEASRRAYSRFFDGANPTPPGASRTAPVDTKRVKLSGIV